MTIFDDFDQVADKTSLIEGLAQKQPTGYLTTLVSECATAQGELNRLKGRVPELRQLPSWERAMIFQKTYLMRDRLDRAFTKLGQDPVRPLQQITAVQATLQLARELDGLVQVQYAAA